MKQLSDQKTGPKELTVLTTSGHRPLWEQPHEFVEFMVDTVLTRTSPTNTER